MPLQFCDTSALQTNFVATDLIWSYSVLIFEFIDSI